VINNHFKVGDTVEIPHIRFKDKITDMGGVNENYTISVGKRLFGILFFYCHVNTELPIEDVVISKGEKPCPTQWLLTGTDGVTNLSVLCELWAKNGEIIPRIMPHFHEDTEIGKELRLMLNRFSEEATCSSPEEAESTYQLIDSGLAKHNTYLQALAMNSKLHLKPDGTVIDIGSEPTN
jgi:hypothetical protein